ncbi:MAG: hypothetical protein ACXAAM_04425 [Candidatus Heimdallarchaeaceae archaeon]|jgi:hypothetical protein
MSSEHEIAIISVGYTNSPLIEEILQNEIIPFSIIANNSCDFQIHHADPSKVLNYSLEFTNAIEIIAKNSMDSLAVFETLGQFFDFYNPLRLSTLNYLISKYATSIKPENKDYLKAWKQITSAIFEDDYIFPLFEETRIVHIKEGDVEVPVRQFIISKEIETKKNNNNKKSSDASIEEITGLIDLDKLDKVKLCSEATKKIISATGVIIAPTDLISLFVLFSSESFRDVLERTSGKIAFVSPFWPDKNLSNLEKMILEKSDFEATLENIVDLVKNTVDTIIIDEKNSDLVPTLREAGVTVLVENLSCESQQTTEFLDTVLKSIDISLDTIQIEPKMAIEGLGERLVNLFRVREAKKEEVIEAEEILEVDEDKQKIESLLAQLAPEDTESEEIVTIEIEEPEIIETSELLTDEFEMEIIDTEKDLSQIPTPPPKETSGESDLFFQEPDGQFVLPGIEQITQFELEELDSLDVDDHIISSFVDRAISSSASGLEVVFSDLLSLQNNPLLIDKIYSMLMKRLLKSREISPETKIGDMVTYLSAHKPEYYKDKLEKLIEDTINAKEEKEFYHYLKTASLVVKSSLLIASKIIEDFISKFIATEDIYTLDRLKRIINVFAISDPEILQLVCKVLVEIYNAELEKEKINENIIERAFVFLSLFDGVSVGTSLIFHDSEKIRESFLEKLNKMNYQDSFKQIVSNIIETYKEGTYEELLETLQGRELPEAIELEMLKKKYITSLSKVGSIPLELFAERIGQPLEQTEKIIYDMILKEEIPARIELVEGRLYIVQEEDKEELSEEISEAAEVTEEEPEETEDKMEEEKEIEAKPSEEKIENEFTCPQCDRKFSSERGLKMHISRSHKEK